MAKSDKSKAAEVKADKARAAKEAKIKKALASKAAKHTATLRKLEPVAKEINGALERATVSDTRSNDLRLTAAKFLAEASKICRRDGLDFKVWCEGSVTQGFETIRKLLVVGQSRKPAEALEDMRAKNAAANRKARKKAKTPSRASVAGRVTGQAAQDVPPYQHALIVGKDLDDRQRAQLAQEIAATVDLVPVTKAEAVSLREDTPKTDVAGAKTYLLGLTGLQRREVLSWLTGQCEEETHDALGIPAKYKRKA